VVADAKQAILGSPNPGLEQQLPRGLTDLAGANGLATLSHCLQSDQQYPQLDGDQGLVVLGAWGEGYH
jgi:hypothetical protein